MNIQKIAINLQHKQKLPQIWDEVNDEGLFKENIIQFLEQRKRIQRKMTKSENNAV